MSLKSGDIRWLPLKSVATLNDEVLPEDTDSDRFIDYIEISDVSLTTGISGYSTHPFAEAPSRARRVIRSGDVLVGTVRTYLRAIAPVLESHEGKIASTGFAVVRPRRAHPGFVRYALLSNPFVDEVIARSTGVSYPAISSSEISRVKIPVPESLEEQRRIAEFLDRETAQIDELIAKQEQLISALAERRSVFINDAVTGSLSTTDVRFKSGVSWLGSLPANWTVRRFRHLATDTIGLTYSPDDLVDEGEGTLVLRAGNVKDGRLVHSDDAFVNMPIRKQLVCRLGDIVVCARSGSKALVGKCGIVTPEFVGSSFGAFMTVVRSPMNDYLYWVLNSGVFLNQLGAFETSTINQLTSAMLRSFPIAVPPEDERAAIVSALNETTAQIDTTIERTVAAIELLRERRQALISAAVTGQIDVGGAP